MRNLLASGSSVQIPDGVYLMSGPMSPRDGQTIAPVNAGCVVIKADSGYTGQLLNSVDVSYTVRGLVFDGDYAAYLQRAGELQRMTDLLTPAVPQLAPGPVRARGWLMLSEGIGPRSVALFVAR